MNWNFYNKTPQKNQKKEIKNFQNQKKEIKNFSKSKKKEIKNFSKIKKRNQKFKKNPKKFSNEFITHLKFYYVCIEIILMFLYSFVL